MKMPVKNILFSIQLVVLLGLSLLSIKLHTITVLVAETRKDLSTTITVMAMMDENHKQAQKTHRETETLLAIGDQAPNFTLIDENNQPTSLNEYQGKNILLVFAHPECRSCQELYPALSRLEKDKKDITVLLMHLENTPQANKRFKQDQGIISKVLETSTRIMIDYNVNQTPTSILIDTEGKIAGKGVFHQFDELVNFVNQSIKS